MQLHVLIFTGSIQSTNKADVTHGILYSITTVLSHGLTQVRVELCEVEPPKKPRLEKQENRSSPITVQTSKDLVQPSLHDYDETNADDFAMEMGLACVVCR